ncbi:MAG: OmpA family protein [Pseudomonadota bacterium]|nr:OmpA family protein [Pseudomonadota bacterium]
MFLTLFPDTRYSNGRIGIMRGIFLGLASLVLAGAAAAEEPVVMREGITACDLHVAMSADLPAECQSYKGLTRSSAAARTLTRSVNLAVLFEHDSAALGEGAVELLDAVGDFLASDVNAGQTFEIVGHTNSLGTDGYNMGLSERRANAVTEYLVKQKHIAPERLHVLGLGESAPLPAYGDDDPRQRRVELKKL